MQSVCFAVPAFGRFDLARICLEQLRRTCDAIVAEGIHASATVVGDDANLAVAADLGFATIPRDNTFVSRKFNDAISSACDAGYTHVAPCGSDDWVDHRLFLDLPRRDTMVGFRSIAFVREDGREINTTFLDNPGGAGIRIYPRELLEPLGFRPADEDRPRGCDTSILVNLQQHWGDRMRIEHRHLHDYQLVDWKTSGEQLNSYEEIAQRRRRVVGGDPFETLAGIYPDEALDEMRAHYAGVTGYPRAVSEPELNEFIDELLAMREATA